MSRYLRPCCVAMLMASFAADAEPTATQSASQAESHLVFDRSAIERSGWFTLGDFLTQLAQTGSGRTRGQNGFSSGDQTISLGNLGSARTLLLLNGRRLISAESGAADLSVYPLSAIERIEIQLAGNSARTGSGAVGGTINLVTRTSLEGLQVAGQFGEFDEGDGQSRHIDAGYGKAFKTGSVHFNVSHLDADPVVGGARTISETRGFATGTAFGSTATPQGRFGAASLGSFGLTTDPGAEVTDASDFRPGDFSFGQPGLGLDRYNSAAQEYILHQQERTSLFARADWSWGDSLRLDVDGFYSQRDATLQFAPPILALGLFGAGSVSIAADNAFNPFGERFSGSDYLLGRRLNEAGNQQFLLEAQQHRLSGALSGDFELAGQAASWRVQWVHGRQENDENLPLQIDTERVAQALSGQFCRDDLFADGCVELNVFGGQGPDGRGTITPEMLSYITFDAIDRRRFGIDQLAVSMDVVGPALAGGDSVLRAGLEWRQETVRLDDAARVAFDKQARNVRRQSTDIAALNLSAELPVTQRLNMDLAARFADLDQADEVLAAHFGTRFAVNDQLTLSFDASNDYVAPGVIQLATFEGVPRVQVNNPCQSDGNLTGCQQFAAANVQSELEPETTRQWQLGLSYQPAGTNLKIWTRYRDQAVNDVLSTLNSEQLVNACAFLGRHCEAVTENSSGSQNLAAEAPLFALVNDGDVDVTSVDMGAQWVSQSGHWKLALQAQYTADFDLTLPVYSAVPGSLGLTAEREQISTTGQVRTALFPRWRASLDVGWRHGPWHASWAARFTDAVREGCSLDAFGLCNLDLNGDGSLDGRQLGSVTYHDLQVGYDLPAYNTELTVGVQNLTDKNPPLSTQAAGNFYTNDYRTPGRYPYLRVAVAF
ncbi:MAG: TonB-dependent receptor plug domain-containing protein [Lysobacterales bacterium]